MIPGVTTQSCRATRALKLLFLHAEFRSRQFVLWTIDVSAKLEEECRCDDLVEHRRCQHAAKHNQSQRVEDFFAGLPGSKQERQQPDEAGGRRHHHGRQTLQAAANDHLFAKRFAFVFHQMNVVRNHHDAVAADDADQT